MRGLCSLRLSNCGDIKSLAPIAHLAGLEVLIFDESTRILDDNLSVLLDLPALRQIAFRNRRTYSHTCEELEERIRIRDIT